MSTDGKDYTDFVISRDYLLRVTAERDALRARIEAAPVVALRLGGYGWLEMCDPDSGDLADLPDGMKGKRVRLVLENDSAPLESESAGIVRMEDGE